MQYEEILHGLAPQDLPVYRSDRYDGSGFSVEVADFESQDIERIHWVYLRVDELYQTWRERGMVADPETLKGPLEELISPHFIREAQRLGEFSLEVGQSSARISKALHDLKSGALNGLVGYSQLLPLLSTEERKGTLQKIVFLARDYAKIARNLIRDIDPEARMADEQEQEHGIDHFLQHWQGFEFRRQGVEARVQVESTFEGSVTNRCLETSTVDRILYNLLNNAGRFAVSSPIRLNVLPVGDQLIRWVVSNTVDQDQKDWLNQEIGDDLSILFLGGHTRDGHGLGLRNCTDIVVEGFGLGSPREAVARKYLGAQVVGDRFFAWFHWPVVVTSAH